MPLSIDVDRNYRGNWDIDTFYKQDEIVRQNNRLYKATRNIASGFAFDVDDWQLIDDSTSHVGYVPSSPANLIQGETYFDAQFGVRDFARSFDLSKNGDVMIVSSRVQGNDSTGERIVNIYRQVNGQFTLSQSIEPPHTDLSTGAISGFGDAVSISEDGMLIAISEPYNNSIKLDQGKVYVYKQTNGEFVLSQTLNSPNGEQAEQFGSYIDFDGNQLAVTSLQGDIKYETTFEEGNTTFDNGFLSFKTTNLDSGAIYVYQRINQSLNNHQNIGNQNEIF